MKVSEVAKEYNTTSEIILEALRSMKLKAKDASQELSVAVVVVLEDYLEKKNIIQPKKVPEKPTKEKKPAKAKKTVKKTVKKAEKTEKTERVKKAEKTEKSDKKVKIVNPESGEKKKVKKPEEKKPSEPSAGKPKEKIASDEEKKSVPSEVKKKMVKKTVTRTVKKTVKKKSSLSANPMVAVKPLARKKKKVVGGNEVLSMDATVSHKTSNQGSGDVASASRDFSSVSFDPDKPLQEIEIKLPVTVKDLSIKIQQKPSVVLKELMKMGLFAHINQSLDESIVAKLTSIFGFSLAKIKTQEEQLIDIHKNEEEDEASLKSRAPVITFMGHVDHGKTSLLDRIRKSKVVDYEHGGITQHMSAYSVEIEKGRITFLDTPGHEAFTAMRARGAHITDIVILVVAADEGVMPQTEEAIDHARAAGVPIVVALNKIDRKNADIDRVKKELNEKGLNPEDWGGKTIMVPVSAMTGEGIDQLLEMILLESEMLELKANPDKKGSGIVVEAHLSQGKGAVTTLIVQSGTLKNGDMLVVGPHYGKIRAMLNDRGQHIDQAGPSMPAEVLGLPNVPEAGEKFYVVEDERYAREICFKRQEQLKNERLNAATKITLENLQERIQEGSIKELSVIIKSDVQGSVEALKDSLSKIPSEKVKLRFVHCGVGDVNTSDIVLAHAAQAVIIAFHVGIDSRAKDEMKKDPVDIREYRIIYDAVNDIRKSLEGLLEAKVKKNFVSRSEVRQVFKLSRSGIIAGCYVVKGKVNRKANADLIRDGEIIHTSTISSLKRFKDDVREVNENMECGIALEGFDKYQEGDIIETFEIEKVAQRL